MAITKVTTPDLINLPYNNTDGVVLPKGSTVPTFSCDYLVLAGGGGGGNFGGGGAVGLLTTYATSPVTASGSETKLDLSVSVAYTVTVGTGGTGNTTYGNLASSGNNSVFHNIIATGGGAGNKSSGNTTDINGGSGGGGGWSTGTSPNGTGITGQGFDGSLGNTVGSGYVGGGGGSASETPAQGVIGTPGQGGEGVDVSITGSTVDYAGGGGGVGYQPADGAGAAPTKGGGGAGSNWAGSTSTLSPVYAGTNGKGAGGGSGGNGGTGVVVIRVPTGITATFSGGVTANGSTGGTIAPDTSTGDNIWIVTATTNSSQTITFSGTLSGGRPTNPVDGEFRYNTTDKKVEYYDGSSWWQLNSSTSVPQSGTTGACNYPTTATNLFQFNDNVTDTCGNNNGTAVNAAYATGNFGKAYDFSANSTSYSGTSAFVTFSDDMSKQNDFSWSFWLKSTGTISNYATIISFYGSYYNYIYFNPGISNIFMSLGDGADTSFNTGMTSRSSWYHLALTKSSSTGRVFYVNGSSVFSDGTTANGGAAPRTGNAMKWKIKRQTNDELRQNFIDKTVAQAEVIGLQIPDPDLKWNEDRGHYDCGEMDWEECWNVVNGNGPCNKQRLAHHKEAHDKGEWVRKAAQEYAKKESNKLNN